jgi:transcriptional regulator
MYMPPAFRDDDLAGLHATVRAARLCSLVTATAEGLIATPLPLLLDESEREHGVLYGHVARANPQWRSAPVGEALAIFMGPDAYVSPSWYATKQATGKVVPTWNYVAVHAYGVPALIEDPERVTAFLGRLVRTHEAGRPEPWTMDALPADYLAGMLRGIVAFEIPLDRLEGKAKLSQNRGAADRSAVRDALAGAGDPVAAAVAALMAERERG